MNGKLEEHLQKIRDFIQIDDKIVTYKWISKALKVHSNTAKQLLYAFVQKPELKDQLLTTYVIAGETGGGLNIRLVKEDDLEETKKKFSKVTSIHVYSVQKGDTVSGADIYNADGAFKLSLEDQKYCSIRPAEDIGRREMKIVLPRADPGPSATTKKPALAQSSKQIDAKTKETAPSQDKEEATKRTSPRKTSPKKNEIKKPSDATKGGGIGALFMKQAAKKKEESTNKVVKEKEEGRKTKEASDKKEEETQKKLANGKAAEKDTVKTPTTKPKTQSKKKRKKPSDSKDSAAKRRKRIQVASDSESSEESESDGDQRYPSPEPEPEAPTVIESEEDEIIPATPVEKGRKRVRKEVDRTYEDEDGYIITKKEYVIESCSDDEVEPAAKKPDPTKETAPAKAAEKSVKEPSKQSAPAPVPKGESKKNKKSDDGKKTESAPKHPGRPPAKAKASNSPKKQTSIMSFFKKN